MNTMIGYELPAIMAALTGVTGGVMALNAFSRNDLDIMVEAAKTAVEDQAVGAYNTLHKIYAHDV